MVMRQAFAGMLWSKQLFDYDVARWLDGDPTQPTPPASRPRPAATRGGATSRPSTSCRCPTSGSTRGSRPGTSGSTASPSPTSTRRFAKYQLLLICREWFQHPNGALPAYEWDFGDVNPPVQAWAALEVFAIDGGRDLDFLSKVFDKLLVNFTWWVNREDADGSNLFEGGFLGLDNIGPIDRSHLPVGGRLEQSDATGWMAFYALAMASIAAILNRSGQRPATDLVLKFLEHFAAMSQAMKDLGVWDETDGLYYDKLITPDGTEVPVKVRSMVGIIPLLAAVVVDEDVIARSETVGKQFARLLDDRGIGDLERARRRAASCAASRATASCCSASSASTACAGCSTSSSTRPSSSRRTGCGPCRPTTASTPTSSHVEGITATIDYEPAESTTAMFGGNSNWRGPLWFPLNYLVVSALERYHRFFGDDFTGRVPDGQRDDADARQDRRGPPPSGWCRCSSSAPTGGVRRSGWSSASRTDPAWKDNLVFNEYFHGDNGAGLGATHQTGWTGVVADLIRGRPGRRRVLRRRAPRRARQSGRKR